MKKVWSDGIPEYKQEDLMTDEDLLSFAMNAMVEYEFVKNNYEIIAANSNLESIPHYVVKVDVYPHKPIILDTDRDKLLLHAKKFHAKSYFALVGIGACDGQRFEQGLALKHDAYYINYEGLTRADKDCVQ